MKQIMVKQIVCAFILLVVSMSATAVSDERLRRFIASDTRTEAYVARDVYRHPQATLEFFQVRATDTVVEIWPGGGWYAEILGPWLNAEGSYYAAHFSPAMEKAFFLKSRERFQKKLVSASNLYGNTKLTVFYPPAGRPSAPAGSV
ncbi:MAG: methyltransferase, partial [Pseudomonadota bacterium]|nr:methyltransferase [Pseudomonadota bacterium]